MKRLISCLLLVSLLLYGNSIVALEDIELDNAIVLNAELSNLLTEYFNSREQILNLAVSGKIQDVDTKVVDTISSLISNNALILNEVERSNAVENLKACHGVYPVSFENSFYVTSYNFKEDNATNRVRTHTIDVYEWTWVEYTNGYDNDINIMGFATEHEIVAKDNGTNGSLLIYSNKYDELDVFGEQENSFLPTSSLLETEIQTELVAETETNTNVNIDVNQLIDYADQYVIHAYGSSMMSTSYYNSPMYGHYSNADCANFVSQCLFAGGMVNDYGSGKDNENADATQWWYDTYSTPTNNNYEASPMAWRFVPSFIQYWTQKGYANVSATNSSVFPGNPVLSGNDHVGICVGYNSAGIPIINAHNRDVYHVPYTMIGTGTRTTIQINTTNKMVWKPSDATTITPTTTAQSISKNLTQGSNHYFKITVTSATSYIFESTGSLDLKATLYKETHDSNGETLYLYQYSSDDNSGNGNNFLIEETLSAGTYYIRVRAKTASAYGQYYFRYYKN